MICLLFVIWQLRRDQLFVVVVPLTALIGDLVARATRKDIRASEWSPHNDGSSAQTGLLFIGCKLASSTQFLSWATRQAAVHRTLRMVIFEEAHVPLVSSHYRAEMESLRRLRTLETPVMLLSGTVPPCIVPELRDLYGCTTLHVIRDICDRPNLKYQVRPISTYSDRTVYKCDLRIALLYLDRLADCPALSLMLWRESSPHYFWVSYSGTHPSSQ